MKGKKRGSGQSLSKRAKNLLLRRRGRGYFSRRTTFLTKLNVFFTYYREEKKVRRYLKNLPRAFLSLYLRREMEEITEGERRKGKRGRERRGPATPSRARISSCNFCWRSN